MLVIIAILCSIGATVGAVNTKIEPTNGTYGFSYADVITNIRLLCVNRGANLPDLGSLQYKADGDSFVLQSGANQAESAWAYLFARNQERYGDSSFGGLMGNPLQEAVWAALNGDIKTVLTNVKNGTYDIASWKNSKDKLLKEAYAYSEIVLQSANSQEVIIDTSDVVSDMTLEGNAVVGPFKVIGCPYLIYDDELQIGVNKITINDGEAIYKLFYYKDGDEKEYINDGDILSFNKHMSTGFYIEFEGIPDSPYASIKIQYRKLDCKATVYPLKSAMTGGIQHEGGEWYCKDHEGKVETNNADELLVEASREVLATDSTNANLHRTGWVDSRHYILRTDATLPVSSKCSYCGKDVRSITSAECPNNPIYGAHSWKNKTIGNRTISVCEKCAQNYNGADPTCPANITGYGKHNIVSTYVTYYTFTKITYEPFSCNNYSTIPHPKIPNTYMKCGTKWTGWWENYADGQPLAYVESELNYDDGEVEEETNVIPMLKEITIEKSNIITNEFVDGAKFSGSISNIKSFYLDKQRTVQRFADGNNTYSFENISAVNGKFSIYFVELADKEQPVVIKLRETTVPEGYVGIDGEVTITIDYLNKVATIDDGHKTSEGQMEEVVVDGEKLQKCVLKIDFRNDPKPQTKITLNKIDNDNENAPIQGVKFNGTIENAIRPYTAEDITEFSITTGEDGQFTTEDFMIKDITKPVKITLTEVEIPKQEGFEYRKLSEPITLELKYEENSEGNGVLKLDKWNYAGGEAISVSASQNNTKNVTINMSIPNDRIMEITGQVWLDGDTVLNNKTNGEGNGKKDAGEAGVPNVIVYLKNSEGSVVKTAITDENGAYSFKDVDYDVNGYYIEFEYDGIHYERTIDGESKAEETGREAFNSKFHTITNGKATNIDGVNTTALTYATETSNGIQKSTIITTGDRTVSGTNYSNVVLNNFAIIATSDKINSITEGINLGLVLRGTDLAASNKVSTARVTINGEETSYTYNSENNAIDINRKSSTEVSYNLNIRKSDYTYRIRDYVNNQEFTEKEYTDNSENSGNKTGEELKVYVTYQVDMTNQSPEAATVNQIVYDYDSRYTFNKSETDKLNVLDITESANKTLTINTNAQVAGGSTKSIYLVFELPKENIADNAEYYNAVEITSYSTDNGLIDIDSEPGNLNYNKTSHTGNFEDDSDEAGGVKVSIREETPRTVSGYVFEDSDKNGIIASSEAKVNDVIVQLIELKTIDNKQLEYIWEETVSGTGKLKKLSNDGQSIEDGTYEAKTGYYEFSGFIPGNYIVRFIYGDGTTYDLNSNVTKYNGQDYKSTIDSKYTEEWYDVANYSNGASVARDNEARRLETMAYTTNVDVNKGILLKLLDVQKASELNEVEKTTIIAVYNSYYDPDIKQITDEEVTKLLKEQTLKNTWMCAETSKINVGVDANANLENVYFGLAKRPETEIRLDKYITGFKLTASNGQVLVNATVNVEKYFEEGGNVSDYIEGIKDSIQAINEYWKYEVDPTTINTVVEGATLEFEYTVVVSNVGEKDYLPNALITAYNNGNYDQYLKNAATTSKTNIKLGTHAIGTYLGSYYYNGTIGANKEAPVEIIDIRDYIRNDLKYVGGADVAKYEEVQGTTHYVLNADYSLGVKTLNTVLHNEKTSGKLTGGNRNIMYAVKLQAATALSAAGNMDFYNYIAEVMSYTNAAGRRAAHSTPGNAEIIDNEYREGRTHEIDEAATADIQIGAATGEDAKTSYVWLITIAVGVFIIAAGTFTTKKFIIKK